MSIRLDKLTRHGCIAGSPLKSPCSDGSGNSGDGGGNGDGGGDGTCEDPAYRTTHLGECGDDPRCSDPAFAAANPGLCLSSPRLVLKPARAQVETLRSVRFRAYSVLNGVETELTTGVRYTALDASIALIGASSGNATGVGLGITTVTAEYGAQHAYAQLEVLAEGGCALRENAYVVVLDVSKSSSATFGGSYATRLAFAKAMVIDFINHTNLEKDKIAIVAFDSDGRVLSEFSQDAAALIDAVNGASATEGHTDISAGLDRAQLVFDDAVVAVENRVTLLFTDAENNEGNDPVALAQTLQDAGQIIIGIGLRAKYNAYRLLDHIASGGFFLNALPSNAAQIPDLLNGFKSYLCSGNCEPPGNVTTGVGQLNFAAFNDWDVIVGHVDLIGKNDDGPELYDLLPGNGLYVDLCGSTFGNDLGTIRLKDEKRFPLVANKTYRVKVMLSGNQREARTPDVVTVNVLDKDDNIIATTDITFTDFATDFTEYTIEFVPTAAQAGGIGGRVSIGQKSIPPSSVGVYGNMLKRVLVQNVSDGSTLYDGTFSNDNAQFIPPACGPSVVEGSYGYNCYYYGCLESPVPAQSPDPEPLPDLEGDVVIPPTIFVGVGQYTAVCDGDDTQTVTRTVTVTSDVSQADADQRAYAEAYRLATDALVCFKSFAIGAIINVQFNDNWRCSASGTVPCSDPHNWQLRHSARTGPGAIGIGIGDFWNQSEGFDPSLYYSELQPNDDIGWALRNSEFEPTGVRLWGGGLNAGVDTEDTPFPLDHPDMIFRAWKTNGWFQLHQLPAGSYEIYLFGHHGSTDNDNAEFTLKVGTFDTEGNMVSGSVCPAAKRTTKTNGYRSATLVEGMHYVVFRFVIEAGQMIQVHFDTDLTAPAGDYGYCNGFQLRRIASSNNTSDIVDNDTGTGVPFPSRRNVDCHTGLITNVQVTMLAAIEEASEVDLILEGPDGTHVLLMSNCGVGGAVDAIGGGIVFDDSGAAMPASGVIVDGTYKPTQFGTPVAIPTAPCPLPPHSSLLSAFNGKSPNGIWKLYYVDRAVGSGKTGTVFGWELVFTTA